MDMTNKIILIGNGFDLAHGNKTSYKDFINDFWDKKKNEILSRSISDTQTTHYEDKVIRLAINNDIWEQIKEQNADFQGCEWLIETTRTIKNNARYNCSMNFANSFIGDISDKVYINNWADIEYEYYLAIINCVKGERRGGIKILNEEFSMVRDEFINYLKGPIHIGTRKVSAIFNHIEGIICPNGFDNPSDISTNESTLFLNFNYTDTLDEYVQSFVNYYKRKIECINIHGELNSQRNPIIFGYGDDTDANYKLIEDKNKDDFLDHIKPIKYSETPNYRRMLSFIEPNKYEIYIMGHSCGISDRTLLSTLFEHENCSSIKIFYHKWGDGTDNFSEIYRNISRNFKDKKLLRSRVIDKTKCEHF